MANGDIIGIRAWYADGSTFRLIWTEANWASLPRTGFVYGKVFEDWPDDPSHPPLAAGQSYSRQLQGEDFYYARVENGKLVVGSCNIDPSFPRGGYADVAAVEAAFPGAVVIEGQEIANATFQAVSLTGIRTQWP